MTQRVVWLVAMILLTTSALAGGVKGGLLEAASFASFGLNGNGARTEAMRVYVAPFPDYLSAELHKTHAQAVHDAIMYWDGMVRVEFVDSPQESDARVLFAKDLTPDLGQVLLGRTVQLSLGDSDCNNGWTPYASETLMVATAHEFGHLLGYRHENESRSIMYHERLGTYATPCTIFQDTVVVPNGQTWAVNFSTPENARVTFVARGLGEGVFGACVVESRIHEHCHTSIEQVAKTVAAQAGIHTFGLGCLTSYGGACAISYVVSYRGSTDYNLAQFVPPSTMAGQ